VVMIMALATAYGSVSAAADEETSTPAETPSDTVIETSHVEEPQLDTVSAETPHEEGSASEEEKATPATDPVSPSPTIMQTGLASWYGAKHHGKRTASGEVFNQKKFTAAHPTLPWGSMVKVTNLSNGKSVTVRINDRGPFVKDRIIDLSRAAAMALGIMGLAPVQVELLSPVEASDKLETARAPQESSQ